MASKIQIWNMALGFIGTRTVASETEKTLEAIQCGIFWDMARKSIFEQYPFNFAQRKRNLAEKEVPIQFCSEWQYAYGLPDEYVNAQAITDTNNYYEPMYFEIATTDEGEKILLCNISPCYLHYTADVKDASLYSELFSKALAYKLASLIVIPLLKNNTNKIQELTQLYEMAIQEAITSNARQQRKQKYVDEWLGVRGNYDY